MNEEQILQYIESNDELNKLWFIWQGSESNSINDFYLEHIRDDLDDRVLALTINNDIYYDEAEKLIDDADYFVLTDEEADEKAEEWAWELADDAESEIPNYLRPYFDKEKYARDYTDDDRGGILNSYNGDEEYIELDNGTSFYIYRRA